MPRSQNAVWKSTLRGLSTLLVTVLLFFSVPSSVGDATIMCGGFRWPIKTLSDEAATKVNYTPKVTSVDTLRSYPPPRTLRGGEPRLKPTEFRTFRVKAMLLRAKVAEDHDIHVVIAQPNRNRHTMIVEFPDTHCNGAARSPKKAAMRRARNQILEACGSIPHDFVLLEGQATITGVGFWDQIAGQVGVAPNGIELHPVLQFTGSCRQT